MEIMILLDTQVLYLLSEGVELQLTMPPPRRLVVNLRFIILDSCWSLEYLPSTHRSRKMKKKEGEIYLSIIILVKETMVGSA